MKSAKTKRWRAELGSRYYFISTTGFVDSCLDVQDEEDSDRFRFGNYFRELYMAEEALESVRDCLRKTQRKLRVTEQETAS